MEKLVILDGSSLLSTSFYGNLPKEYYGAKTEEDRAKVLKKVMQTSAGVYTNGVFTMCKILLKLIEKQKPTHLAVAWDVTRNTFRRELYPEYKAQREETKPELKSQFALMQEVLDAMGIYQFKNPRFEADDIIGTLAKRFEEEIPTYIMTKDQDSLQLVSDYTRVWLITSKAQEMYDEVLAGTGASYKELPIPDNVFEFTPLYIEHFYGVKPIQIIDLKALEGDKSDNIPGVRGVGEKASVPLIKEFGSVENLYDRLDGLNKEEEKAMKELLKEIGASRAYSYLTKTDDKELVGKEAALLSKKLATIVTNIDEVKALNIDDLKLNINKAGMEGKFTELEFKSLIK